jgi:quinol monooxygenase YgiN
MNTSLKTIALFSTLSLLVACGVADPRDGASETQDALTASPSAPLVVTAVAKVKPGTEADFEQAAERLVVGTRAEAGNLGYVLHRSKTDPTQFLFYETWASAAASDAHMKGPVLGTFFAQVKDEFEPGYPQLSQYEEIPVGKWTVMNAVNRARLTRASRTRSSRSSSPT